MTIPGLDVYPVQRMYEVEAGNQHGFSENQGVSHLINGFGRRLQQAIRDGASRLWRWCTSLLAPSHRGHQLSQMDRKMLSLFEEEKSAKDTLSKVETVMQLKPVDHRPGKGSEVMEYLQAVKTRAAIELQKVNDQRIATFNQNPLFTSI